MSLTGRNGKTRTVAHTVNNIDRANPTAVITPPTSGQTSQDVTLYIKSKDNLSGVDYITLPDGKRVNGGNIGMVSTMYGDGGYLGTDGGDYSVDSGTLGIVPIEVAELDVYENSYLGRVIEYKGEARVLYEEGLVTIEFKDNKLEDTDIQTGAMGGLEEFYDNWI